MKHSRHLEKLDHFKAYNPTAAQLLAAAQRERERDTAEVETLTRRELIVTWICSLIAAGIMIETLFFKFSASEESVYIFRKMGTEPWMRWMQGFWELFAALGLLIPRLRWAGGILTTGAMAAAILSHMTWLGYAIRGDHGLLFCMALVTFTCGLTVTFINRFKIPGYVPAIT
jgi:hypothetical protein